MGDETSQELRELSQANAIEERCQTLSQISGLPVRHYLKAPNEHVFVFRRPDNQSDLREVFTYRKAKVFAEGVRAGRTMSPKRRLKRPVLHSNRRIWYKYWRPKRLTLKHNPPIYRWLWWVWDLS